MSAVSALRRIGDSIWLIEGERVSFYGFAYPTRSVVIQLENGRIWVWSPVRLTPEIRRKIDTLGPVAHLVSPNKLHHLYLEEWAEVYPEARLWGPASTIRKRRDLSFQPPLGNEAPPDWRGQLEQVWYRGSFLLDEIEFFHPATSTAMLTDMTQNFSETFLHDHWSWWQRPIARFYGITEGVGSAPLELRLSCINRDRARSAVRRIVSWSPTQVVMAHGEYVQAEGRCYLQRAFQWLRP